jgi:hypothetical protein
MKNKIIAIIVTGIVIMNGLSAKAQDTVRIRELYNDPSRHQIIPDKAFELGVPLLLIILIINAVISVFKIRTEARLKEKALDKGISEPTLIELFRDDKTMMRNIILKWFLVLAFLGVALIYIHMLDQYVHMSSGYLALGSISLFVSIALLIYYRITRKQN